GSLSFLKALNIKNLNLSLFRFQPLMMRSYTGSLEITIRQKRKKVSTPQFLSALSFHGANIWQTPVKCLIKGVQKIEYFFPYDGWKRDTLRSRSSQTVYRD